MRRTALLVFLLLPALSAVSFTTLAESPAPSGVARYLPDRLNNLRAIQPVRSLTTEYDTATALQNASVSDAAGRTYASEEGRFDVRVFVSESESAAYSLLTAFRDTSQPQHGPASSASIGSPGYRIANELFFAKGKLVVHILPLRELRDDTKLISFAKVFAESLPRAEDEIPVLVKHLPKWETEPREVSYFVGFEQLKSFAPSSVLNSLTFDGAEAVFTTYGSSQLLLIEFPTPQLATQNDQQVLAKLDELRVQGQPLPTLYRRVGNYGVFVFEGDEASAKVLADEVKYEQVTKWLGENPYPLLEAQRRYTATTLGVLVSVVKASGLAVVVCLGAGGFFGALLFLRRRSQQRNVDAYSDAGGMLRLNLDEMTPQTDAARLLGK